MKKFGINIHCVILSTDLSNKTIYVLSHDSSSIKLPYLEVDDKNVENLEFAVLEHMSKFVSIDPIEIMPQIIMPHTLIISTKKNTINMVYGSLIREDTKTIDSHWINFDYSNTNDPYAKLIIEVIQKLQ
jgi:hypothetical protein